MAERLPWPRALLAAAAYRRCGWSWARIGRHLHYDKARLRQALEAQGYATLGSQSSDQPTVAASSSATTIASFPLSSYMRSR